MKKLIAIAFLSVFLLANTEVGQLLYLPVLAHHFWEHREADNNETLLSFLKKHYAQTINHSDDKHGDHQHLPFKTADCHFAHLEIILQPNFALSDNLFGEIQDKKNYTIEEHYSFAHLKNTWHPPRA